MNTANQKKTVQFADVEIGTAFTPAPGQVGATKVYMKQKNGVCPQLGTMELGSFYPEDKVCAVRVPQRLLEETTHKMKKSHA